MKCFWNIIKCLGASGKLLKMAIDYLRIVLIGFTFLGLAFVFSELIRAQGRAKEAIVYKAIKQINGYQALVINIVPVIDGSVFKGYTETVCKTMVNAKSRNNI